MADTPPPPPGFIIDTPQTGGGTVLPPPPGFTIDTPRGPAPKVEAAPTEDGGIMKGAGEAALNVGSQLLALPAEAAASLYKLSTSKPGEKVSDANKASSAVADAMIYQPKTQSGKTIANALNYPAQLIGDASNGLGDVVTRKTGSAGLGAAAAMIPQAAAVLVGEKAPGLIARGLGKSEQDAAIAAANAKPRQEAAMTAHTMGFKLAPSEVGGPIAQTIQTVAGGPKLEKEISAHNAGRTQEQVKLDLGLHPTDILDQGKLDELRAKAEIPYQQLAATGTIKASDNFINGIVNTGADFAKIDKAFPEEHGIGSPVDMSEIERLKGRYMQPSFTADEAMLAMRQLRKDAKTNLKNYDPQKNALGIVQRQIADVFLDALDDHAKSLGNPNLVNEFKAARVQLAKIQTVDDAMTGDRVSARALARMYDDGKGRPLTDRLKAIAESATKFEKSFQDVDPNQWRGFLSAVDYFIGAASMLHNPALGGAVLARPAARAALKSKPMQRSMVKPKTPSKLRQGAAAIAGQPLAGTAGALTVPLGDSQ